MEERVKLVDELLIVGVLREESSSKSTEFQLNDRTEDPFPVYLVLKRPTWVTLDNRVI